MRLENEILIAAPAERVWALTVDIESWPRYTPTMTSVERLDDGPLRVGAQARVKQPAQPASIWTVTEFVEDTVFAWGTTVLGMQLVGRHEVHPDPAGTRNRLVLDVDGGLAARILAPLLKGQMRAALAKENAGFKAAAEGS